MTIRQQKNSRACNKLLVCHEINYDGKRSNCISNETGVLTVSSEYIPSKMQTRLQIIPIEVDFDYYATINEKLEPFDEHLNAYVATEVERKIIEKIRMANKTKCLQCIRVFQHDEKSNDQYLARNNSNQPCKSTVDIIKAANKILFYLPDEQYDVDSMLLTILNHLEEDELYLGTEFEEHALMNYIEDECKQMSHKENFIRSIVRTFLYVKANKIGKKISDEERGEYKRHDNKKEVHFAGQ